MSNLLYSLAKAGNKVQLIRTLSQYDCVDVNDPQPGEQFKRTPLHLLSYEGNTGGVELLLITVRANIEIKDELGRTPMHLASERGHLSTVEFLIAKGAKVGAQDNGGNTPLHLAAECGHDTVVETLLVYVAQQGALQFCFGGETPLHLAAWNGHTKSIEALLYANVPADLLNTKNGRTPLFYAAWKGHFDAIDVLVLRGASKDSRDLNGATPFHFAAFAGNTQAMAALMVDVTRKNTRGETALHYAASSGNDEAVVWLLQHGASVIEAAENGDTPLHCAARKESLLVFQTLAMAGANLCARNKEGQLAIGLVDDNRLVDPKERAEVMKVIFDWFMRARDGESCRSEEGAIHKPNGAKLLHYAGGYASGEAIHWILKRVLGRKNWLTLVSMKDSNGNTPVHWAAIKGNACAIDIFGKSKSCLNQHSGVITPLGLAVIHKQEACIQKILRYQKGNEWIQEVKSWICEYYASIDIDVSSALESLKPKPGSYRRSMSDVNDPLAKIPTIYVVLHVGRMDIANLIQEHSRAAGESEVNAKGDISLGRTALHWATLLQNAKILSQLCSFGQDLAANAEDACGKTALQYAKERQFLGLAKQLEQRSDVQAYVDSLYRDRQVYVDAANAILVGAALIASVTFAGWLQPPLNYAGYDDLSHGGHTPVYAAIKGHSAIAVFWVFNSLSFFFAIATVLAGADAVVPIPDTYIASSVKDVRSGLVLAAMLLASSISFVLIAFAAAGFAVLPPIFHYQTNMMSTVIVGGIVCILVLVRFLKRLYPLRPAWWISGERHGFELWKFLLRHHVVPGCSPGDSTDAPLDLHDINDGNFTDSGLLSSMTSREISRQLVDVSRPEESRMIEVRRKFSWDDAMVDSSRA